MEVITNTNYNEGPFEFEAYGATYRCRFKLKDDVFPELRGTVPLDEYGNPTEFTTNPHYWEWNTNNKRWYMRSRPSLTVVDTTSQIPEPVYDPGAESLPFTDMLRLVLAKKGGPSFLEAIANEYPLEFFRACVKLIPEETKGQQLDQSVAITINTLSPIDKVINSEPADK